MNNKFKFYLGKRIEIEEAIGDLAEGIECLYKANGQYNKEINIDFTNEKPSNVITGLAREIRELAADFDNTRLELLSAEAEINDLKEEAAAAKKQAEELRKRLNEINASQEQQDDSNMDSVMNDSEKLTTQEKDKHLKLIRSLIKFRDQLLIFKDNAEDEVSAKLLGSLYKETGRFMNENGIEILNKGGSFSTDNQIVVGTSTAEDPELVDTVESTFRDGYIVDGDMIRPQEVVVYVSEKSGSGN